MIAGYLSGYFLVLYLAGRNSNFDQGGQALKFCAETPEGLVCESEPGFDRKYGMKLEPMTAEQIIVRERRLRGQIPQRISVERADTIEFFDRLDGKPRVWYYDLPSGEIELYDRPGRHPTYGEELKPVATRADVDRIQKHLRHVRVQRELTIQRGKGRKRREAEAVERAEAETRKAERRRRYFNERFLKPTLTAVLVVNEDRTVNEHLSSWVAEGIGGTPTLFKQPFVGDGLFDQAHKGGIDVITEFVAAERLPRLVFAVRRSKIEKSTIVGENLVKFETTIQGQMYEPGPSLSSRNFTVHGRGVGFSVTDAEAKADEMAAKELLRKLR